MASSTTGCAKPFPWVSLRTISKSSGIPRRSHDASTYRHILSISFRPTTDLVDRKDYGQDGDRVFILHPAKAAVSHRTSPLAWGADCDYGHDQPTGHRKGSVQLGADPVAPGASTLNLRRLIALEPQNVFPEPELREASLATSSAAASVCLSNATFCIACGNSHSVDDVVQGRTDRDNLKWFYKCSACSAETMRTRCFGCSTILHKKGLQMTYHLTIADQVSNVVCQECGANFGI